MAKITRLMALESGFRGMIEFAGSTNLSNTFSYLYYMTNTEYLSSVIKQFQYYKMLGDKTFAQLSDKDLLWQFNEASNSIAVVVKHIGGNMLSRWTDFLEADGEKEWRHRESEFEADLKTRKAILEKWESGWSCLFAAIEPLEEKDLARIVYIRNIGHTVTEAINRQLAHYAYHIGQIVYVGRMIKGNDWQSLSIPKGESKAYNEKKFAEDKHKGFFTDEFLK